MRVLRSTQNTVTPLPWDGEDPVPSGRVPLTVSLLPAGPAESIAHVHSKLGEEPWARIGIGPALGSTTRPPVPQKSFAALLVGKEPFKPGVTGGTNILGVIWYLLAVSRGHQMAGGTEDSLQLLGQGKAVLSTKQHQQFHCLSFRRLHQG